MDKKMAVFTGIEWFDRLQEIVEEAMLEAGCLVEVRDDEFTDEVVLSETRGWFQLENAEQFAKLSHLHALVVAAHGKLIEEWNQMCREEGWEEGISDTLSGMTKVAWWITEGRLRRALKNAKIKDTVWLESSVIADREWAHLDGVDLLAFGKRMEAMVSEVTRRSFRLVEDLSEE